MRYLDKKDIETIIEAVIKANTNKGTGYWAWKNAPEYRDGVWTRVIKDDVEAIISPQDAQEVYQRKLDTAYSERFNMMLGTLGAVVSNGYKCGLVQFQQEAGVPFDASGWLALVVETMPVFHISPADMCLEKIEDMVNILSDNNAPEVSWKGTNKIGEFAALLKGALRPGLDLVAIAKEYS